MSQESIENKQKYLREKILDKGYDAEAFMTYCQEKYGEIDLNDWTFQKLQDIAQGFIREHAQPIMAAHHDESNIQQKGAQKQPMHVLAQSDQTIQNKTSLVFSEADWGIFGMNHLPKQTTSVHQPHMKLQTALSPSNTSMSPPSGQPIKNDTQPSLLMRAEGNFLSASKQEEKNKKKTEGQGEKKIDINSEKQQIKVEKQHEETISMSKITQIGIIEIPVVNSVQLQQLQSFSDIKIIKTQQKVRNFLQGDYTLYHIKFCPGEHVIKKKFNDFRKLRAILQKMYPHIRLPYLEPEGWLVSSTQTKSQENLDHYMHMILDFLKYITIRNDVLKKTKIVKSFIGLTEDSDKELKKYESGVKPKQFTEVCLPTGKFIIPKYQYLSPVDKYITNMQTLIYNIDGQYQKLRKSIETLLYNYQLVSKSLTEVATIFESLENFIQKFNYDNDGKKDLRIYEGFKQVYIKMKENIDDQHKIFKDKIYSLFKYERQNMGTLKQVNQTRNKMFNEYIKEGLLSSKSSDYISANNTLVQGNFSIQQPCRNNKNMLTLQNLFWNYTVMKNIENYWIQLRFKIKEQLTLIAYEELDSQNSHLNFWNGVIKKCVL